MDVSISCWNSKNGTSSESLDKTTKFMNQIMDTVKNRKITVHIVKPNEDVSYAYFENCGPQKFGQP